MQGLNWLQWPAMFVTVLAAWLVASRQRRRRNLGFWVFTLSNLLWVTWGVPAKAWGVVGLQACLFVLNIRGVRKTDPSEDAGPDRAAVMRSGESQLRSRV
jgi:hypothetical protein